MSSLRNRSWEEMTDTFGAAAAEVRSPFGRAGCAGPDDDAEAARLEGEVSRLRQTASDLISTISSGLREQRSEIASSSDRERAQLSAERVRTSLEDLAGLAAGMTGEIRSAANSMVNRAEPARKNIARAPENVAESAASWNRTAIDPEQKRSGAQTSENRPPLDDLYP